MAKSTSNTSFQDIVKAIKNRNFAAVYFLHGEENYYIDELTKKLEQEVLSEGEKAFNQTILYGKDIDYKNVLDAARRYPIMAEKQLVVIKEAQSMRSLEKLEAYFKTPLESTVLVIAHKHKKLDGRKKYAKELKSNPKVCLFESAKLYDNKIPGWIDRYLKSKKVKIKQSALQLLAEYLGNDLSKISNELDKLCINLPASRQIDEALIQKNIGISKDFNIFELQAALGQKDHFKAFMIVKYFAANPRNHPLPMAIAALYNYFSKLYILSSMLNSDDNTLAQAMGVNRYFIRDYKTATRFYTKAQVERVITLLREYDLKSKGLGASGQQADDLLRELVIKILQ